MGTGIANHVWYQVRMLPRRGLFGNEIGVMDNVRLLRERRKASSLLAGYPDRALGEQIERDAYAVVPDLVPADALKSVQDALWLCDDPDASVAMGGRIPESVRYVFDPVVRIPALREFLTPFAADVVRAWFQGEFSIRSVRVWRIRPIPDAERVHHHYGNLWHMDGHRGQVFKMFVQVSDATAEGSALRLLSQPATRRVMRSGFLAPERLLEPAQRVVDRNTVCFDAPPGSALFADPDRCLHRAGIPHDGEVRDMVQFWFEAADHAPPGGDYFAAMQPDPNVAEGRIA